MAETKLKEIRAERETNDLSAGIDLAERGRSATGESIAIDRRLFMQFFAFTNCDDIQAVTKQAQQENWQSIIYEDINDPNGFGILSFSEHPEYFAEQINRRLRDHQWQALRLLPELTMLGRTYTLGYEPDLVDTLLTRPIERVCNPMTPWAVWYPVRRTGAFLQQPAEEQRKMLMEHGGIGHAFGKAGLATDIRLACHGLCRADMDFVVGLIGVKLFPLSALVQRMRKTRQTAEFIENMGPFFVGRAIYQPDPTAIIEAIKNESNHR